MCDQSLSRRELFALAAVVPAAAALPSVLEQPKPSTAPKRVARLDQAERLAALTGGELVVEFSRAFWEDEPASEGHLYHAWPHPSVDLDVLTVDDRRPMGPQLVAELRRVAREHLRMARKVEAAIGGVC